MFKFIITRIRTFGASEDGAALIEYGIALMLAVTIGASATVGSNDRIGADAPKVETASIADLSAT